VAEDARELPTVEDRAVVRQIVLDEIVGGSAKTAGELLDKLEAATTAERREMLDRAGVSAGLESTRSIEVRERLERDNPERDDRGRRPPPRKRDGRQRRGCPDRPLRGR
jgi:hypothetical protein